MLTQKTQKTQNPIKLYLRKSAACVASYPAEEEQKKTVYSALSARDNYTVISPLSEVCKYFFTSLLLKPSPKRYIILAKADSVVMS